MCRAKNDPPVTKIRLYAGLLLGCTRRWFLIDSGHDKHIFVGASAPQNSESLHLTVVPAIAIDRRGQISQVLVRLLAVRESRNRSDTKNPQNPKSKKNAVEFGPDFFSREQFFSRNFSFLGRAKAYLLGGGVITSKLGG